MRLSIRDEKTEDELFLRNLYASTRIEELALIDWPQQQQENFLRQQFDLQRHHYRTHYPQARFKVVWLADDPIGRWYVWQGADHYLIIDICFLPAYRRQGFGSLLINKLLLEAGNANKKVILHVDNLNPAQNLYKRLGFQRVENLGVHSRMEWYPQHKLSR